MTDVTGSEGRYRFTQLPLGTYQLRYELAGFQTLVREGLSIGAGFEAKVDITLLLGNVAETVTVKGGSPIVDVTTTGGSTTLSPEQLNTLLPSSRQYGDIAKLTPGLVS